jgi:hypothetical protein
MAFGVLLRRHNKLYNMPMRRLGKHLMLLALFRRNRLLPGPPSATRSPDKRETSGFSVVSAVLRTRGLYNINTDDGLPIALHIVKRGRVYPYVRRVAPDLASAFRFSRAPRLPRSSDRAAAYLAAARAHAEIEIQFVKLR